MPAALPLPDTVALPKSSGNVPVSGSIRLLTSATQLFAPPMASAVVPATLAKGSIAAVPFQVRLSLCQVPVTACGTVSLAPRKLTVRLTVGSISRSAVSVTLSVPFPKFPVELFVLLLEKAMAPAPSLNVGACCGSVGGGVMVTEAEYWLASGGAFPHQSFSAMVGVGLGLSAFTSPDVFP